MFHWNSGTMNYILYSQSDNLHNFYKGMTGKEKCLARGQCAVCPGVTKLKKMPTRKRISVMKRCYRWKVYKPFGQIYDYESLMHYTKKGLG